MTKGNFNYVLVKQAMKRNKITNQDLADYITKNDIKGRITTTEAVKTWFRTDDKTRTNPDSYKLGAIGDLLKLSANEMLNFQNECENAIEIRYFPDIYASAGFGTSSEVEDFKIVSVDEGFMKEILDIPVKRTYDIIKINGDSMEPLLSNGDFVVVDRSKNTLQTISNADIVIFRKDDDLFCKKIKKQPFEDYIFLVSENKNYEDKRVENAEFEKCDIIGTVVSKIAVKTFKNFIEVVR